MVEKHIKSIKGKETAAKHANAVAQPPKPTGIRCLVCKRPIRDEQASAYRWDGYAAVDGSGVHRPHHLPITFQNHSTKFYLCGNCSEHTA